MINSKNIITTALTYAETCDLNDNCLTLTSALKVEQNNFCLDKNKKLLGQQIFGWTKNKNTSIL